MSEEYRRIFPGISTLWEETAKWEEASPSQADAHAVDLLACEAPRTASQFRSWRKTDHDGTPWRSNQPQRTPQVRIWCKTEHHGAHAPRQCRRVEKVVTTGKKHGSARPPPSRHTTRAGQRQQAQAGTTRRRETPRCSQQPRTQHLSVSRLAQPSDS